MYLGIGPWAHLVTGNHEQTFVSGLTEFVLCLGDYKDEDHCKETSRSKLMTSSFISIIATFCFNKIFINFY